MQVKEESRKRKCKSISQMHHLTSSIVSQQIITLFSRKTRAVKSVKTLIIILSAARENSNIFNVLSNNSFKRRRIINKLRNRFSFIIQSRLSSRINLNPNLFNSTKNDTNVARTKNLSRNCQRSNEHAIQLRRFTNHERLTKV